MLTENRILYHLKNVPKSAFAYDFETIHINAGEITVKRADGDIIRHRLSDMEDFSITPRNEMVNNCIPHYDDERLNKSK